MKVVLCGFAPLTHHNSPFYQQIASTWETTFIGTDDAQTRSLLHQYRLGKSILLPHRGLLFYRRYVSLKLMELALTHDYDVWIGGGIYSYDSSTMIIRNSIVAGNIVFAWLLTLPAAGLMAAALYYPVLWIF